ncbi:MAG: arginine--tRNA ligase [Thermodesulfobacteriota bacterium]|nr:arginine--tRNA ligase [Thermodesulfobacteriota bacterium]
MKEMVEGLLNKTLDELIKKGSIPDVGKIGAQVSIPTNTAFGDFATNAAMILGSKAKKKPREIADRIARAMQEHTEVFDKVDIAGPGFINFRLHPLMWTKTLKEIHKQKDNYGKSTCGKGKKVQVEFVSANPTGPLHVGHGRGAAVGDTLARILKATGFDVSSEYYINDVGNQMNILGASVLASYMDISGKESAFPENGYKGDYILDLAEKVRELHGQDLLNMDRDEAIQCCRKFASGIILDQIKGDLEGFNVHFDCFFRESSLYRDNSVTNTLEYLKDKGLAYEKDQALWFSSSRFGDEKDRVLRKQDKTLTYFAPDIAYHKNKLDRGFERIIDIWGADHHGYVPRMSAAIEALGADKNSFHAPLIQLVSLVRGKKPVYMSTRAGEFVTLKTIVDEVGKDAARYFFLMRRSDAHLVFDLELATKKSEENPVFYVQYAHARICSILKNARKEGLEPSIEQADLSLLSGNDDLDLIKKLATYPDMLVSSAENLETHRVCFYLLDLATSFHRFYNKNRVISDDKGLSTSRLVLVDAVRQVIRNALDIMGIDAPESM